MPNFSYQAISETGTVISGTVEADSVGQVEDLIASRGQVPMKVKQIRGGARKGAGFFSRIQTKSGGKVKLPELILFTKQLKSMLSAGVPIVRLLQVLEVQTQNRTLKAISADMSQKIKQGVTLHDCLQKHPQVFDKMYCSMVRAGESSGSVPEVLGRLIYIIEHESKIKSEIKSAMTYPIMVFCAFIVAFFVLEIFVIPKFVVMFERINLDLPMPTRVATGIYKILTGYWYLLIGGALGVFIVLRQYLKTEEGKYNRDSLILRIPLIGPLVVKAAMARFTSIFSIMQSSGVAVIDTLKILSGTIGNLAISRAFDKISGKVQEGTTISEALKKAQHFHPMVIDMIAIGEESGNLEEMLREITTHYDEEVEYSVRGLSEAIGPILMIGLTAMVGFFAMAIFLPMWDMTKMAQ